MHLSADGKALVTTHPPQELVVWDVTPTGLKRRSLPAPPAQRLVGFHPDGRTLTTLAGDTLTFWGQSGRQAREKGRLPFLKPVLQDDVLFLSVDGKVVVGFDGSAPVVRTWDGVRLSAPGKLPAGTGPVAPLLSPREKRQSIVPNALSADGRTFARGELGKKGALLWGLSTFPHKKRHVLPDDSVLSLALSPDGRALACRLADGTFSLLDLTATPPKEQLRFKLPLKGDGIRRANGPSVLRGLAPDGRLLFAETNSTALIGGSLPASCWLFDLNGPVPNTPIALGFPGGNSITRPSSVAFTSDSGRALISQGRRALLWERASRKALRQWELPGEVVQVAFAPDDRHALLVNSNGTIYVLRLDAAKAARK